MESARTTIRPLARADRGNRGRPREGEFACRRTTRTPAHYDASFERPLSGDPHDYHARLAVTDRSIGIAHQCLHARGSLGDPACYPQELYVKPTAGGASAGRAPIEAVYADAGGHGARGVYRTTKHLNAAGRRLYDRMGEATPFNRYQRPSA